MARIRTVKPSFYRHEELIDLEISHCDLKPMLVFSALWGHCDKNGVFEWKPRCLQLDIIPFYWEATGKHLSASLMLLRENGFVKTMTDGQKVYGFIPTFTEHQRLSGKEAKDAATHPEPAEMTEYIFPSEVHDDGGEALGKQWGSSGEALGNAGREGKGREWNGVGEIKNLSISKTEQKFISAFEEKETDLRELFPDHDYEVEKATCVAHYRTHPPPIDPYVLIVKWFRRASKKPPAPANDVHRQTEQDLREKGLI